MKSRDGSLLLGRISRVTHLCRLVGTMMLFSVVVGFQPIGSIGSKIRSTSRRTSVTTKTLAFRNGSFIGRKSGRDVVMRQIPGSGDDRANKGSFDDEADKPAKAEEPGFVESILKWLRSDEGRDDIRVYFLSLLVALTLRFFIIEPRFIPSLSMFPTFEVGDQLAVEKVTKRVKPLYRNEVVVFNPPQSFRDVLEENYGAPSSKSREALIKRIVAVEGDKVQVTRGKLYVNGVKQDETFTAEDAAYEFGPVTVPVGNVLVLGDNRNHSLDGHIWGFLPKDNIIGRAVFVYWPPWRIGNAGMY